MLSPLLPGTEYCLVIFFFLGAYRAKSELGVERRWGGGSGGRFSQHKALEPRDVDSGNDRSSLAEPEAAACVGPLWLECALSCRQSPALTMPVDEGLEVTQQTQVLLCDEQLRQLSLTPGCSQTFPAGSRKLDIQAGSLLMQPGEGPGAAV